MNTIIHNIFPIGVLILAISLGACVSNTMSNTLEESAHYKDGEFINSEPFEKPNLSKTLAIIKRFVFEDKINTEPKQPIPVMKIEAYQLNNRLTEQTAVYRLGHSTILMELSGQIWMTDPVFSERGQPKQKEGTKRI